MENKDNDVFFKKLCTPLLVIFLVCLISPLFIEIIPALIILAITLASIYLWYKYEIFLNKLFDEYSLALKALYLIPIVIIIARKLDEWGFNKLNSTLHNYPILSILILTLIIYIPFFLKLYYSYKNASNDALKSEDKKEAMKLLIIAGVFFTLLHLTISNTKNATTVKRMESGIICEKITDTPVLKGDKIFIKINENLNNENLNLNWQCKYQSRKSNVLAN